MNRNKSYSCALGCPIEATLDLIGGKWKGVVLYHLADGMLRFNETPPTVDRRDAENADQAVA